jgi:cytochrome c oxidase assembly protein subunit 11
MKHRKLVVTLSVIVLGMFGFAFALVPIYNTLCQTLGINGKTIQTAVSKPSTSTHPESKREILVEFVATNNAGIPWLFYPKTKRIQVRLGEISKLSFYAENQTNHRMTVQAIPSVTPGIAAKYIKKTECFCFERQTLNGHEAMDMPLLFHVDTDLPAHIKTITLSYTLFDVTSRV